MRARFLIPFSLFLFVACQLNGAGKLPAASNAPAIAQSTSPLNADTPSRSSPAPGVTTETSPSQNLHRRRFREARRATQGRDRKEGGKP